MEKKVRAAPNPTSQVSCQVSGSDIEMDAGTHREFNYMEEPELRITS